MAYVRPPGTQGSLWEDFREDTNLENTGDPQVDRANFELWKNQRQLRERFETLSNFNSEFFQQFRGLLGKITPTGGTDTNIASQQAGGGNFANSQFLAGRRQKAFLRKRSDFLNTTTTQFALGSQRQASGILGELSQNARFMAELAEQRRQFDINPDAGDFALAIAPSVLQLASDISRNNDDVVEEGEADNG